MIKVVFKKAVIGDKFRFRPGQEAELSDKQAREFLNAGFCVAISEPPKARAKKSVAKNKAKETR